MKIIHTGVFATPEEALDMQRPVHHAAVAAGTIFGRDETPAGRLSALCRAYGLPDRPEPGARFAMLADSGELIYALPEGER